MVEFLTSKIYTRKKLIVYVAVYIDLYYFIECIIFIIDNF